MKVSRDCVRRGFVRDLASAMEGGCCGMVGIYGCIQVGLVGFVI